MDLKIRIDSSSVKEFKMLIKETVESILKDWISKIEISKTNQNLNDEQLLTRTEVMQLLNISHSTLYHYQRKGVVPFLKIGKRVYFKRKDILNNPFLEGDCYDYK